MKISLKRLLRNAAFFSIVLSMGIMANAQDAPSAQDAAKAATSKQAKDVDVIELPDTVEISPFAGVSLFGQVNTGLVTKHVTGGVYGIRLGVNPFRYVGIEGSYSYSTANVRFLTPVRPGDPTFSFGNRIHDFYINPVLHFTPRGSRVRPYVTVGVGGRNFSPTSSAKDDARDPASAGFGAQGLNSSLQVALNYGGGIKAHISDHIGFRVDARGFLSRNPTYMLPDFASGNSVYIPSKNRLNGVQVTAGLIVYLGKKVVPAPPAPPPPPAPLSAGTITGTDGLLCQGKPITLHSTASDAAGHALNYAWKLNGAPQTATGPDLTFTPNNGGEFTAEVAVTDATNASRTATGGPVNFTVKQYVEPTIAEATASPATIKFGESTTLSGKGTGSDCSSVTCKWTVSEGSLTEGSDGTATFDSKSLNFEQSAQQQTKTITATLTCTDDQGKSTSKTVDFTVTYEPQLIRLADIIFPKNNARINNCGKRVLIDEVAPKLNSDDYDVVLVGHIDNDETATPRKGRRAAARSLDEQRVLNAAAVLSGGTGTCANVAPSKIKVDWVGTDQTAEHQPALCGTSARGEQQERRSSRISESDQNRRVEVWLVPKGGTPPSAKALKDLPEGDVKKLGCPK